MMWKRVAVASDCVRRNGVCLVREVEEARVASRCQRLFWLGRCAGLSEARGSHIPTEAEREVVAEGHGGPGIDVCVRKVSCLFSSISAMDIAIGVVTHRLVAVAQHATGAPQRFFRREVAAAPDLDAELNSFVNLALPFLIADGVQSMIASICVALADQVLLYVERVSVDEATICAQDGWFLINETGIDGVVRSAGEVHVWVSAVVGVSALRSSITRQSRYVLDRAPCEGMELHGIRGAWLLLCGGLCALILTAAAADQYMWWRFGVQVSC